MDVSDNSRFVPLEKDAVYSWTACTVQIGMYCCTVDVLMVKG